MKATTAAPGTKQKKEAKRRKANKVAKQSRRKNR
jgi:hypothetical protein